MQETWFVDYKGKRYPCLITYKRVRNINFRLARDASSLKVSAPYRTSRAYLTKAINKVFPSLMEKSVFVPPSSGDEVYLFGAKEIVEGYGLWDEKKQNAYLKSRLLPLVGELTVFYEGEMGIQKPYQVKVRAMKSRYGVNSLRRHSLTYSTELAHYGREVIASVVVHELAHDFERNHGQGFYAVVYKYCPNYRTLYVKLRKHLYE
jgi:predicted metal-dependent hydrolase